MHLEWNERLSSRTAVASICPNCLDWLLAPSLESPCKGLTATNGFGFGYLNYFYPVIIQACRIAANCTA